MADALDKLGVRELLLHLPELISGDDPVLGGVRAAAYVREHPEARAAIVLAGGVVGALQGAPTRLDALPVALPRELWRPLDQARRLLARELAELLDQVALWFLQNAASEAGNWVYVAGQEPAKPSPEGIQRGTSSLAAHLGVTDAHGWPLCEVAPLRVLLEASQVPALSVAQQILVVCDRLSADNPLIRLHLLLGDSVAPHDPDPWLRYVRETTDAAYRASGLQCAALAMAARSRPREALILDNEATLLFDDVGIVWNAIQHALGAGNEREVARLTTSFRESWARLGEDRRSQYLAIARQADWARVAAASPRSFGVAVSHLPQAVADLVDART